MKQLIKLDIACGQRKQAGYVGIDIAACEGVDVVHNLNHYPWPVEGESVTDAYCSHYIEHIPLAYWNPGNTYTPEMQSAASVDALCKFFEAGQKTKYFLASMNRFACESDSGCSSGVENFVELFAESWQIRREA